MIAPYTTISGLASVYLENSFVLSIDEQPQQFSFTLEAALHPEHPQYHPPLPGEQFCYVDALLVFDDVTNLEWLTRSNSRFTDASGDEDLGNIDSLTIEAQNHYLAHGDWGWVRIWCPNPPRLALAD